MTDPGFHLTAEYLAAQKALHVADESRGDASALDGATCALPYLKPSDWVLDIGCKTGIEQDHWREQGFRNTIGLDLYPERALARGVAVIQCDMHTLPFGDQSFDFVYCRDTLEHSPYPERVVAEVYRVLRPRAYFYLSSPVNHNGEESHYSVLDVAGWRDLFPQFLCMKEWPGAAQYSALYRRPG